MTALRHRPVPLHLAGERNRRDEDPPAVDNPRLVSPLNPHGTPAVARLLRRLNSAVRHADHESELCANGCGRLCAERVRTGGGPGAKGGKRPDYCGRECSAAAKNRRRRERAGGWVGR